MPRQDNEWLSRRLRPCLGLPEPDGECVVTTIIDAALYPVAKQLHSRYRGFVDLEDIRQQLWVWVLTHTAKLEEWTEEHHPKAVERLVATSLRRYGERYCRKEKAAQSGYETDDEHFYSLAVIADMLTLHLDPEWSEPQGVELEGRTSGGRPPQEGWNLQAMVADVGKEFERLSLSDKELLRQVYETGDPRDNIAALAIDWGDITWNAANHRVRRVLGRIRVALGGPDPWRDEDE